VKLGFFGEDRWWVGSDGDPVLYNSQGPWPHVMASCLEIQTGEEGAVGLC
jgi:hypothetical protein